MPVGVYPSILAGQDLTAALTSGQTITAWKAGSTSRATSATLAADPDLVIPVLANATYELGGYLIYSGAAVSTGDLQIELTPPTGPAVWWWSGSGKDNATLAPVLGTAQSSGNAAFGTAGATSMRSVVLQGSLITSTDSGSLTLLWAQATSSSTATVLYAGSRLSLRRLA
jgi:hypothetical protein